MMAWRLARSLQVLEAEVQKLHPGTTVWDIGDEDHQDEASDHNPNQDNVVCATDTLGDAGLDLDWYAQTITRTDPPALKYVIWNRRIWFPQTGWQPYRGSNPHTGHVHVSVGVGPDGQSTGPYDDTSPWGLLEEEAVAFTKDDLKTMLKTDGVFPTPTLAADGTPRPQEDIDANPHWWLQSILDGTYDNVARGRKDIRDGVAVILAAIRGEDVAQAAAQAARDTIRAEFATLGPALAEQLSELPAERVEAALRAVLRTGVDEPAPEAG